MLPLLNSSFQSTIDFLKGQIISRLNSPQSYMSSPLQTKIFQVAAAFFAILGAFVILNAISQHCFRRQNNNPPTLPSPIQPPPMQQPQQAQLPDAKKVEEPVKVQADQTAVVIVPGKTEPKNAQRQIPASGEASRNDVTALTESSQTESITAPGCVEPISYIYFYNRNDKYYELTNFFENIRSDGLHTVNYKNKEWKTSEHAFQGEKFNHPLKEAQAVRERIAKAATARDVFEIAKANIHLAKPDWHQVKDGVMLDILRSKFSDEHLSNVLKRTGARHLIEDSPVDSYWGCGADRKGINRLGELLMQVRRERFGF